MAPAQDPIKPNPNVVHPQVTEIDFSILVQEQAGMLDFGFKAGQSTTPISDIGKAELAKELDPIVLKLRGNPNEPLAKLIFVELNDAWSQFESETN